jgi:hypothetical protein
MRIIFGLILFFSLCGFSNAQTPSTGEKFSDKLNEQYEVADKIAGNVLQMLKGSISEHDQDVGMMAYDNANAFDKDVDFLLTLSFIYTNMRNDQDKRTVKKFFNIRCEYSAKSGQVRIERINEFVSSIRSVALVNEITKLRDAIGRMTEILETCKK